MKLLVACTFGAAAVLLSCGGSPPADALRIIEEAARDRKPIDLRPIAGGQWDKLVAIPPYSSAERIEQAIGGSWSGSSGHPIASQDDITLLLFVNGKSVVSSAEIPRRTADFSKAGTVPADQAVFAWSGDGAEVRPGQP